jgi:hypothetical protein
VVVNGSYENVLGATAPLLPRKAVTVAWLRASLVLPDGKPSLVLPNCN